MNSVKLLLDSGAVNFYNKYVKKNTKGAPGRRFSDRRREKHEYASTDEFKKYRNAYIHFIKKNKASLSAYINLDIINNAKASYESLKYMESKGLTPLPVFHIGNDVKWLERYIKEGYGYICLGGITPNPWEQVKPILDKIWSDILTDDKGMPILKVHGLAATSFPLMKRYPWFSVDSTSWLKMGVYGSIYVPVRKKGVFILKSPPYTVSISAKKIKQEGNNQLIPEKKKMNIKQNVRDWLSEINVPLGSVDSKGEAIKWGVTSNWEARCLANARYFQKFVDSLPLWPWPFKPDTRNTISKSSEDI